jgi:hypothetical protein
MNEEQWLKECKALVRHASVWAIIWNEWDWAEAWATDLSPAQAVRFALLDVLAPEVGAQS